MADEIVIPKPELNRLYRTHQMHHGWLWMLGSAFRQLPVPTETVVTEARMVIPIMGRVWLRSDFYVYADEVMTYHELRDRVVAETGQFGGTSAGDSIYLTEVYDDHGDDGHVDFNLVGYRFVRASLAGPNLEYMTRMPVDPNAVVRSYFNPRRPDGYMFSGAHQDDYERQMGRL